MIYQIHEFYHPRGLSGTSIMGIAEFRKKAEALAACEAHPFHASVNIAGRAETLFDNGKPNRVEQ